MNQFKSLETGHLRGEEEFARWALLKDVGVGRLGAILIVLDQKETRAMKQIEMSTESLRFDINGAGIGSGLKRIALGAVAVVCLTFASQGAFASCGLMTGEKSAAITLPALAQAGPRIAALIAEGDDEGRGVSIVGLWHTKYTTGGALFAESFKLWHSDGTELDNIDQNPTLGSVCVGVWKQLGAREVRLHHVGWVFGSDGTPAGSFTLDETETLAANGNSYTGSFTFRTYDVNGNFTGTQVTGDVAATRITVN